MYGETLNAFQYRREVPVEQISELVRTVLSTWPERAAAAALRECDLSGILGSRAPSMKGPGSPTQIPRLRTYSQGLLPVQGSRCDSHRTVLQ